MTKRIESALRELSSALDEEYGITSVDNPVYLYLDISETEATTIEFAGVYKRVIYNVSLCVRETNKIGGGA